jgi:hypothetical protein
MGKGTVGKTKIGRVRRQWEVMVTIGVTIIWSRRGNGPFLGKKTERFQRATVTFIAVVV